MRFKQLYEHVDEGVAEPPVRFEFLRGKVNTFHEGVGKIDVYPISYSEPNGQAHYRLIGTDRASGYSEEFDVARIQYCSSLDSRLRMRRYVLTKELMHVFDTADERIDTREKFVKFLREIQNQPLAKDVSPGLNSELDTRWMAAIILCPPKFRNRFIRDYRNGSLDETEIAEILRLPDYVVPWIMDPYYEDAFDQLLKK